MEWDREDGTVADHYIWNTRKKFVRDPSKRKLILVYLSASR